MLPFRRRLASGTLHAAALSMLATFAAAQTSWPPGGGGLGGFDPEPTGLFKAWVDPVEGLDSATPQSQINDPDAPFKTLQRAINAVHTRLVQEYPNYEGNLPLEGIVYALPGLYGPHGPKSSGDVFPISLKDRVHVRGAGARRAIIRGAQSGGFDHLFWPIHQPSEVTNDMPDAEVLVDLIDVHPWHLPFPPWVQGELSDDLTEVFDGFTLQGGDVQILAWYKKDNEPMESNVTISNCIFDMRHDWPIDPGNPSSPTVQGPYVGIYMLKTMNKLLLGNEPSYVDQKLLITNNTFIMAQWRKAGAIEGWINESRPEAVGILDACDPLCSINFRDCDDRVRGLGNPAIINNVFRTAPTTESPAPAAMLGIDDSDTRMSVGGSFVNSNAFASGRVGGTAGTNGYFYSLPVIPILVDAGDPSGHVPASWHCQATIAVTTSDCGVFDPQCPPDACVPASLPVPRVEIYDGPGQGVDPGFVGEFLSTTIVDPQTSQLAIPDYVDWRLLPGQGPSASPLKDAGYLPDTPMVVMLNGTSFPLPERENLSPFNWDGEHYGNPRVVDGLIDIGFDEVHLMIMAGSYGNDSNSHNEPGALNPQAPQGKPDRYVLLRKTAGGVALAAGNQLKVHGVQQSPAQRPPAWTLPPGVLSTPLVDTNLPIDYRTKYITFNNSGTPPPPTPFNEVLTSNNFLIYPPLNGATGQNQIQFVLSTAFDDDEAALNEHAYFNTQALIKTDQSGSILLRSNLQAEYR